jgi:excisionase family DNA binding protein
MSKRMQVREVAEQLGCSQALVYREIQSGRMPHIRLTEKRVVVDQEELEKFLNLRRVSAEQAASKAARDGDIYR